VILDDLRGQTLRRCAVSFGQVMIRSLAHRLRGRLNRGLKQKALAVLGELEVPGVLLEVGFLDHGHEGRLLMQKRHNRRIVAAIRDAVKAWQKDPVRKSCRCLIYKPGMPRPRRSGRHRQPEHRTPGNKFLRIPVDPARGLSRRARRGLFS